MIKKELLKMPKLRATPYMLRKAKADKPKDVRVNKYTNWSYLRCCTKKGILKVSFFYDRGNAVRRHKTDIRYIF